MAKIFRVLGAQVWDADAAAKSLYRSNRALREAVIDRWGESVALRGRDGRSVDVVREEVAARVFGDPHELAWLESNVHPAVADAFESWLNALPRGNSPQIAVREAAILFESNSHLSCDYVVTVEANEAVRMARALARANMDSTSSLQEEDIQARMDHQWPRSKRVALADFVIENGDQDALLPQALKAYDQFLLQPSR